MEQSVFTIIDRVDDVDGLRRVLSEMGSDPSDNDVLPLGQLERAHFASLTVRTGDRPLVVFELNVDGSIDDTIADLVDIPELASGVAEIFGRCRGWPGAGPAAYLTEHVQRPAAFHIGNTGRSRSRTRDEAVLVAGIETRIDDAQAAAELPGSVGGVATLVRNGATEDAPWAFEDPGPNVGMLDRVGRWLRVVPAVVPLVAIVVTSPYLLVKEARDRADWTPPPPVDPELAADLEAAEDRVGSIQNHMLSIVDIKPGPYRRMILRSVLFVIERLARALFIHGKLGSISTIHFAHWAIIDDGRSLMFLSNFDGSWESYLDDFIEKVSHGLTAVWSSCDGFPPARFLIGEGATHGPEFKAWARASMHPTLVWYQAYPTLGVTDIDLNSRVRRGLGSRPKDEGAWLDEL